MEISISVNLIRYVIHKTISILFDNKNNVQSFSLKYLRLREIVLKKINGNFNGEMVFYFYFSFTFNWSSFDGYFFNLLLI